MRTPPNCGGSLLSCLPYLYLCSWDWWCFGVLRLSSFPRHNCASTDLHDGCRRRATFFWRVSLSAGKFICAVTVRSTDLYCVRNLCWGWGSWRSICSCHESQQSEKLGWSSYIRRDGFVLSCSAMRPLNDWLTESFCHTFCYTGEEFVMPAFYELHSCLSALITLL